MNFAERLEHLKAEYRRIDPRYIAGLHPPTSRTDIVAAGNRIGYPIPGELADLYFIHNGQDYQQPGTTGLFGSYRFHTLDEMVGEHSRFSEPVYRGEVFQDCPRFPPGPDIEGYYHRRLLPFASWDVYSLCIDALTGCVWEFSPNSGVWLTSRLPSIAAAFDVLLGKMRDGRTRPDVYHDQDD